MADTVASQTEQKICYTPGFLSFTVALAAAGATVAISDDKRWLNALVAFLIFFIIFFITSKFLMRKDTVIKTL